MSTPTPAPPAPLRNSYWVLPGKVLAGEHPTAATVEATRERLQRLIDAGVECFIDLTEPGEIKPYDTEIPFSIEYLRKPIKDHGIPSQRAHMAEILDCIHDALQSGRCVYVHCRAGIGRTGTVIGCLLVERGFEGEGAIDELNRLWQQSERSQNWPSVPETDDQVGYVRKWKARAVFAEELSLASAAARNVLVGKAGTVPAMGPAGGPTAGANALLGLGQAPAGAAPDSAAGRAPGSIAPDSAAGRAPGSTAPDSAAGRAPGSTAPDSAAGRAPGGAAGVSTVRAGTGPGVGRPEAAPSAGPKARSGGPAADSGLSGLGLPLLDDGDDNEPSDFATFNKARGMPSGPATGASPTPAAQPDQWPAFGKQPAGGTTRPPEQGAPTGSDTSTRGPTRSTGAGPSAAGVSASTAAAKGHGADRGSNRDPAGTAATQGTISGTRTPALTGQGAPTGSATPDRGPARDPATPDIAARAPAHPGAPAVITPNTTPDDDPLSDPEALSAARTLRERFLGALLGLAVGDAVSAATQFRKPGSFTPVGDMIGGGPFDLPRGGWSDDTAMALCLADSLLERDGFDARDQMERYRKWQQEGYLSATGQCVGITASSARAIAMSAWRRGALFGSHDPAQLDPEPLSRVAPAVMFFFAASGQAIDQATEAARTTCQAPAVLDACRSLARALHAALSGQPKAMVLEKAVQAIGGNTPGRTPTGISATAALTAAIAAFGATANFRDAVLYAANLGGDSDVVAAVCGQLAGAFYSVKAIPTSWHNGLMQKELIISYADRLLAHAMLGLSA